MKSRWKHLVRDPAGSRREGRDVDDGAIFVQGDQVVAGRNPQGLVRVVRETLRVFVGRNETLLMARSSCREIGWVRGETHRVLRFVRGLAPKYGIMRLMVSVHCCRFHPLAKAARAHALISRPRLYEAPIWAGYSTR